MSQTHPRYSARDFERRWQTRLNTPPRHTTNNSSQLHAEVTHCFPASNRYGWELRPVAGLPVEKVARSIHFLGRSQSGRQTRSEPILAIPLGSIGCERRALSTLRITRETPGQKIEALAAVDRQSSGRSFAASVLDLAH